MEIRSLISKFLTSLVEKNYAKADQQLKNIVESKTKNRIANVIDLLEGKSRKEKLDKFDGIKKPKHKSAKAQKVKCTGKANCTCANCDADEEEIEESNKMPKIKGKEWHGIGKKSDGSDDKKDKSKKNPKKGK
jgi:hypothetical protein